jgi:hypothetical protein
MIARGLIKEARYAGITLAIIVGTAGNREANSHTQNGGEVMIAVSPFNIRKSARHTKVPVTVPANTSLAVFFKTLPLSALIRKTRIPALCLVGSHVGPKRKNTSRSRNCTHDQFKAAAGDGTKHSDL